MRDRRLTRGDDLPDFSAEDVRYGGSIGRDVEFALRNDLLGVAAGRDSASQSNNDVIEGCLASIGTLDATTGNCRQRHPDSDGDAMRPHCTPERVLGRRAD